jgi:hypothetical protein
LLEKLNEGGTAFEWCDSGWQSCHFHSYHRNFFSKFGAIRRKLFKNRIIQLLSNFCFQSRNFRQKCLNSHCSRSQCWNFTDKTPRSVKGCLTLFCKIAIKWQRWFAFPSSHNSHTWIRTFCFCLFEMHRRT